MKIFQYRIVLLFGNHNLSCAIRKRGELFVLALEYSERSADVDLFAITAFISTQDPTLIPSKETRKALAHSLLVIYARGCSVAVMSCVADMSNTF